MWYLWAQDERPVTKKRAPLAGYPRMCSNCNDCPLPVSDEYTAAEKNIV